MDGEWEIEVSPTLLFRFSALTYNAHRIHYDRDYCRDVESYPGLLTHGPLQALAMAEAARAAGHADGALTFEYRLVSPLFDYQGLIVGAVLRRGRDDHRCPRPLRPPDCRRHPHARVRPSLSLSLSLPLPCRSVSRPRNPTCRALASRRLAGDAAQRRHQRLDVLAGPEGDDGGPVPSGSPPGAANSSITWRSAASTSRTGSGALAAQPAAQHVVVGGDHGGGHQLGPQRGAGSAGSPIQPAMNSRNSRW